MNAFTVMDPSKSLAIVCIRVVQILSVLTIGAAVYLVYFSSQGLLAHWDFALEGEGFRFSKDGNPLLWQLVFFAFPALVSLAVIALMAWLETRIRKE